MRLSAPRSRFRYSFLTALLLTSLVAVTGCEDLISDEPVEINEASFTVSGAVTIDVNSVNGNVTVNGSGTDTVHATATLKRADQISYDVQQFGNSIQVTASQNGSSFGNSPSADIEISAPSNAHVVLRTSNGSLTVRNLEAGAVLRTSNGRITVDGLSGDLEADTSNGTIEVSGHAGSVELETSNGGIRYSGELAAGSDNGIRTSNGSVTVTLKSNTGVRVDASTSNSGVTTSLPIQVTSSGSNHLEGLIGSEGNGVAELQIRSSNGSIQIN